MQLARFRAASASRTTGMLHRGQYSMSPIVSSAFWKKIINSHPNSNHFFENIEHQTFRRSSICFLDMVGKCLYLCISSLFVTEVWHLKEESLPSLVGFFTQAVLDDGRRQWHCALVICASSNAKQKTGISFPKQPQEMHFSFIKRYPHVSWCTVPSLTCIEQYSVMHSLQKWCRHSEIRKNSFPGFSSKQMLHSCLLRTNCSHSFWRSYLEWNDTMVQNRIRMWSFCPSVQLNWKAKHAQGNKDQKEEYQRRKITAGFWWDPLGHQSTPAELWDPSRRKPCPRWCTVSRSRACPDQENCIGKDSQFATSVFTTNTALATTGQHFWSSFFPMNTNSQGTKVRR